MFRRFIYLGLIVCLTVSSIAPSRSYAVESPLDLPAPGSMIDLTPAYQPVIIRGMTIHRDNPFLFDFIVDEGQDRVSGLPLKKEGEKLIKYFLASLAIPDRDVWVNLSPYEKSRIIPESLGQTDMGRDLLEQDYILKQLTSSLIYPEKNLGREFWDTVYKKAQAQFGTTQIPVNTFNKVWIMADRAQVFERNQTVFVVDSHLKVMLEEDYLALSKTISLPGSDKKILSLPGSGMVHSLGSQVVRQIVLPELEKEVNQGQNFANLRQIFNSIILANWYKNTLKAALLNQFYANRSYVKGININDPGIKEQIYQQYLKAYRKGVFNYIKEDSINGINVPRKYFSGGVSEAMAAHPIAVNAATGTRMLSGLIGRSRLMALLTGFILAAASMHQTAFANAAMLSNVGAEAAQYQWRSSVRAAQWRSSVRAAQWSPNIRVIDRETEPWSRIKGEKTVRYRLSLNQNNATQEFSIAIIKIDSSSTNLSITAVANVDVGQYEDTSRDIFAEFKDSLHNVLSKRDENTFQARLLKEAQIAERTVVRPVNGEKQHIPNLKIAGVPVVSEGKQHVPNLKIVEVPESIEPLSPNIGMVLGDGLLLNLQVQKGSFKESEPGRAVASFAVSTSGKFLMNVTLNLTIQKISKTVGQWAIAPGQERMVQEWIQTGFSLQSKQGRPALAAQSSAMTTGDTKLSKAEELNLATERIKIILREDVGVEEEIGPETRLVEDLRLGSLDLILLETGYLTRYDLVISLEKTPKGFFRGLNIQQLAEWIVENQVEEKKSSAMVVEAIKAAFTQFKREGKTTLTLDEVFISNAIRVKKSQKPDHFDVYVPPHPDPDLIAATFLDVYHTSVDIKDQLAAYLRNSLNPRFLIAASKAMASFKPSVEGGIDLNTSNGMQWQDTKDGYGVQMSVNPAMLAQIKHDGINFLSPVILKMTAVTDIWPLMGLKDPLKAHLPS